MYGDQVAQLLKTESELRNQLAMYGDKFEQFQVSRGGELKVEKLQGRERRRLRNGGARTRGKTRMRGISAAVWGNQGFS